MGNNKQTLDAKYQALEERKQQLIRQEQRLGTGTLYNLKNWIGFILLVITFLFFLIGIKAIATVYGLGLAGLVLYGIYWLFIGRELNKKEKLQWRIRRINERQAEIKRGENPLTEIDDKVAVVRELIRLETLFPSLLYPKEVVKTRGNQWFTTYSESSLKSDIEELLKELAEKKYEIKTGKYHRL